MFSNIRSIAVDEVERIYVLDWREAHVKVFGGNGRYIKTIGKKGQGPVMPTIRAAINQNDQIVTGYPEKYEIKIFDKSGTLIRKIMKEYDPVEITEEEIEDATEGMPPDMKLSIPKCHNAYSWFITHDEGRIFVQTYERAPDECDLSNRNWTF